MLSGGLGTSLKTFSQTAFSATPDCKLPRHASTVTEYLRLDDMYYREVYLVH